MNPFPRPVVFGLFCSMWIFQVLLSAAIADEPPMVVVEPPETDAAPINPDMGWTLHYYSNIITNYGSKLEPSDTVDNFPGLSTIYLRVPWSFLEPSEGRFEWSLFDTPAQRWTDKGCRVAIRVSCSESWMRWATPEWVARAGAKGNNFTVGKGVDPDGPFWEPDYADPVFLEKLDHFLAAMAARYDGNPNVAFIDVGSYGVWGEAHTWASTKLPVSDETKIKHIDLYRKYFQKTLLAVSDDIIGPDNRVDRHPITDYMLQQGITLRDDSICVQPPPQSWFHDRLAQSFWPKLPVVLEHEHYGSSVAKGAWGDGSLLLQSVEDYHAAFMSIHWWPHEFLEKNRETIDKINRRLGYRLVLQKASWPRETPLGRPLEFTAVWANVGVTPCYPGGFMAVTLKDEKGGIVSVHVADGFDLRGLEVGPPGQPPSQTVTASFCVAPLYDDAPRRFSMPTVPDTYDVFVSVGKPDGTPVIGLPLPDEDGHRRYRLGRITILPREEPAASK